MHRLLAATFSVLTLAILSPSLRACGLNWAWTVEEALREAERDHKLVLLFFTGSDWSPRSIALDQQVFERGEFSDLAASDFSLYLADFPQRTTLNAEFQKANGALAERLHIRHFPTIVALKPDGSEYARLDYKDESAVEIAGWLTWWENGYRKELATATVKKEAVK